MAGIAPVTHNVRASMVGEGIQETGSGMTVSAFSAGIRVAAAFEDGGRLTCGHSAVVARAACPGNTRMIKAAIRF